MESCRCRQFNLQLWLQRQAWRGLLPTWRHLLDGWLRSEPSQTMCTAPARLDRPPPGDHVPTPTTRAGDAAVRLQSLMVDTTVPFVPPQAGHCCPLPLPTPPPWWPPSPPPPGRYLWTDAFGVCNFLTLAAETADRTYLEQADTLITGWGHQRQQRRQEQQHKGQQHMGCCRWCETCAG